MNNLLFILPILIISNYSNPKKVFINNDLEKFKLHGKVKSLKQSSFWANEKFGKLTKLSKYDDGRFTLFNEHGNIIQDNRFDGGDKLTSMSKFKYDSNNKIVEKLVYMPNGKLSSKTLFNYDKNGNLIQEIEYNNDGSLSSKKSIKYDNKRNVSEENIYHADGRLFTSTKYEYFEIERKVEIKQHINMNDGTIDKSHQLKKIDENGNDIEIIFYDSEGNIIRKEKNKYDEKSSMIESKTIYVLFDNKESVIINKYEYDGNGNWIKMYHYGEMKSITEREIIYYK